jgi:RHS repeat-associated protein
MWGWRGTCASEFAHTTPDRCILLGIGGPWSWHIMKRARTSTMPRAGRSISKRLGGSVTSKVAIGTISRGKGQQFDYTFDTIGNRTLTQAGGDQMGLNLRVANYTNNSLNQITSRDYPGYVDVMGDGLATNAVTVNSVSAYRKNEYFREQVSVANTSSPVWEDVTVAAPGQTSVTGYEYVPKTPENYTYDADGNLLSDGRWNYVWDGENRLVSITSLSGAPSGSQLQLNFVYDYMGRRIQKAVAAWSGSAYTNAYTHNYVYDGWNCVGTLDPSLNLLSSFMWGLDLSGSVQGAGGVGGLIREAYYGASTTNCFVAFDGNGNVSALVNGSDGTTLANYDYGPFGEVIRASGLMAKVNLAREGTKIYDDETDLAYYGYRYYNPSTGRWLSRDPIGENAGKNLYGFIFNNLVNCVDGLGLKQVEIWASAYIPYTLFTFPYPLGLDPTALWAGDVRTGPQVGGSSRAFHWLTIETSPGKPTIVYNRVGGGITQVWFEPGGGFPKNFYASAVDTSPSIARVSKNGSLTSVSFRADTSDPLAPGAPTLHSFNYPHLFSPARIRIEYR